MNGAIRSKIPLQRPRKQFRAGLAYTRHSLAFELFHPTVVALTLAELLVSLLVGAAVGLAASVLSPSALEGWFLVLSVGSYFLLAIPWILLNAIIAGYVLAAELGVIDPFARARERVRTCIRELCGYAVVWASVLSGLVGLDWLATSGLVSRWTGTTLQVATTGSSVAWAVGTVFVVPILVFERTSSLRSAIRRSAGMLRRSALCLFVFWLLAAGLFATFVAGGLAVFFLTTGPLALFAPLLAVFAGIVVSNTLTIVFISLLYGELAGPLAIDP